MVTTVGQFNHFVKYLLLGCAVFLATLTSIAASAESFTAQIDRTEVREDETLNLTFRFSGGQASSDPDFTAITQNFDVLSNSKSMQHSIINGNVTSYTDWKLIIAPKKTGQLLIPPITFNNQSSRPLRVNVSTATNNPQQLGGQIVAIEGEVDKTTAYVQEQIILTYRLYYSERISFDAGGDFVYDNTRVEELPKAEYQRTVNGQLYNVLEFRFALFPDASGTLTIPQRLWQFQTNPQSISRFGYGGGRQQLFRKKTEAMDIQVKPRPSEFPAQSTWLPAKSVTLSESWSESTDNFKVGEPITRTLILRAEGLTGEQLPVIYAPESNDEFKYYPDKPTLESEPRAQGMVSLRKDSVAVVPNKPGRLSLPAIEVAWWNTETDSLAWAKLPARTVTVSGSARPQNDPNNQNAILPADTYPAQPQVIEKTPTLWIVLLGLSVALNLLLIVLLVYQNAARNRTIKHADSTQETHHSLTSLSKQLRSACAQKSAPATRDALLKIKEKLTPGTPATLSGLADLSNDLAFTTELITLDGVIFAGKTKSVDYELIQKATMELIKNHSKPNRSESALPPLYAN